MHRVIIKHIIIVSLLFFAVGSTQAQKRKNVDVKDTVQVAFMNGIYVYADLVGAYQIVQGDHGQWQGGVRVNLKDRYFPAIEAGLGKADMKEAYTPQLKYNTKAPFFRIGCDFNILNNKHDIYKAFAGVRYGFTSFNYDITTTNPEYTKENTTVPAFIAYDNQHGTFHWIEGVIGVDAKIWGPFHLGWDVRYRRRLAKKYDTNKDPWYVPGYGNGKPTVITANFNITLAF